MSNAANIKKSMLLYTTGSLFSALIGFIFIPYYMKEFSTSEYGTLSLIQLLGIVASAIFYLGISSALNRFYFDANSNKEQVDCVYTAFVLSFLGLLLQMVLGYATSRFFSVFLFGSESWSWAIFLSLTNTALIFFNQLFLIIYRLRNKPEHFFVFSLFNLLFNLIFIYGFVLFAGRGVDGVFEGAVASQLLMFIVFVSCNRNVFFDGKFSLTIAMKQLRYGVHFIWASIASLSILWIDQFFINKYLTIEDVGVYAIAAKFATVMTVLFVNPFFQVLQPIVMEAINDDTKLRSKIEIGLKCYVLIGVVLSLLVPVVLEEFIYFLNPKEDYLRSIPYMFPLFFSAAVYGMVNIVTLGFSIRNKLGPQTQVFFFVMILNLALNVIFIPNVGVWGAVISTLITYSLAVVLLGFYSGKIFQISYPISLTIVTIFLCLFSILFNVFFLSGLDVISRLISKFILFFLLPGLLLVYAIKNNKLQLRG